MISETLDLVPVALGKYLKRKICIFSASIVFTVAGGYNTNPAAREKSPLNIYIYKHTFLENRQRLPLF